MDDRALIGAWFRQQAEMALPDLVIDPSLTSLLKRQKGDVLLSGTALSPPGTTTDTSMANPSRTQKTTVPELKNRLASLRPVDQLVKTAKPVGEAPLSNKKTMPVSGKRDALKELYLAGCSKCPLAKSRTTFVFGGGNADAPVMVIGEAPGHEEDAQGLPFVGAAGKLLTDMFAAINLDRNKDVFITNILKCHPPGNRNPESSEIVTCMPLLIRQIAVIQPKAIMLLGRIAAHALLEVTDSIAKLRSKVHDYKGIPTMVIYHPAALLRNAGYKRPAWEDLQEFQKLLTILGVYGSLHKK